MLYMELYMYVYIYIVHVHVYSRLTIVNLTSVNEQPSMNACIETVMSWLHHRSVMSR